MHTLLASRPNVIASTRVDARRRSTRVYADATRHARCERGLRLYRTQSIADIFTGVLVVQRTV